MSEPDSASMAPDEVFEILSSQRRRMVLYYLRKSGGTATMNDLAEQIAAWENDMEIEDLTAQQRKRVYVSLYQTHLPKLAETSLVEYDVDAGDIELTEQVSEMDEFLTSNRTATYPWRRHYLGLVVVAGALAVVGAFAAPVLGSGLLVWLAGGILAGYLVTIAVEYWYHRKRSADIPDELVPENQ